MLAVARSRTSFLTVTATARAVIVTLGFLNAPAARHTPAAEPADLVLFGRVFTADDARPWAEAVAVRGERICFVGARDEGRDWIGPDTRVMRLESKLIVPGFNDAHLHLMSGAMSLARVDLNDAGSVTEMQDLIRAFAAVHRDAEWVLGRGWTYGSFAGGLPTRQQLDAAISDRPAMMSCYDGHTAWCNSRALDLAGITKDTPDPPNGEIVRDPTTGEPTGALKESAVERVWDRVPETGSEERYALLVRAIRLLNSQGITSVQDASLSNHDVRRDLPLFRRAEKEGKFTIRFRGAIAIEPANFRRPIEQARVLAAGHARDPRFRFDAVKGFVDGVIESHTAAMLEPYSDNPQLGRGVPKWEQESLNAAVLAANEAGLQVWLHAIGDGGVRMALDAHQFAREQLRDHVSGDKPRSDETGSDDAFRDDPRGRIEHIETIDPADYARFQPLGVIASMQPLHATPDANNEGPWLRAIGPERATRAFSWANIERAGGRLAFGSDWPVVTSDVARGLYCATTRKTRDGKPEQGWGPELAVSLTNALRHYTIDAAHAGRAERETGSITVGKLADLAVLSDDPFQLSPASLLAIRVALTVMNGQVVHDAVAAGQGTTAGDDR